MENSKYGPKESIITTAVAAMNKVLNVVNDGRRLIYDAGQDDLLIIAAENQKEMETKIRNRSNVLQIQKLNIKTKSIQE